MLSSHTNFRSCTAYLRTAAVAVKPCHREGITAYQHTAGIRRRVLIVEFRDEVYAALKSMLEKRGFDVERADCGPQVGMMVRRFAPDLILVNEDMPHEDGWLIAAKLQFGPLRQSVWLYAVRLPRCLAERKEVCGVDRVVTYGGVLARIVDRLEHDLAEWRAGSRQSPRQVDGFAETLAA